MVAERAEAPGVIRANWISTIVCAVIALFSLVTALTTDSVVLLLDSSGWLIGVITGVFYDRVLKTLRKPPSVRYHFGYAKFEPFSIVIEAVLILGACFFTVKVGIQDILHPDEVEGYGLAIALTLGTGIIGFLVYGYLSIMGRKQDSSILKVNAISWLVDAVFAFGVCGGFLLARYLSKIGQGNAAAYVDPAMGIILAVSLIPAPFKILKGHLGELLDQNPGGDEEKQIRQIIDEFKDKWGMRDVQSLRIRKAGSRYFIDVCFVADSPQHIEETIKSARLLEQSLQKILKEVDAAVRFEIK